MATILSLLTLTAFAMPKTALHLALANEEKASANQSAAMQWQENLPKRKAVAKQVRGTQLVSPNSYEQYLSLSAPTDVAVSANYTAIADGNTIYVFDRKANAYFKYTHGEGSVQNKVTKLQFDGNERLYFLDASTALYSVDPQLIGGQAPTPTKTELVCSTFAIHGDQLYYTNTSGNKSQISHAPLSNLTFSASTILVENLTLTPVLAFYQNELYYTDSGQYLKKIGTSGNKNDTFVTAFPTDLISLSILDGALYCITGTGDFYSYNLTDLIESKQAHDVTPVDKHENGYSALTLHDGFAYLIEDKAVVQYSLQNASFTDFEINGASARPQRLQNATDVTVGDDKIFISDAGNQRVSVYDMEKESFLDPIPAPLSAQYIASDSQTVLIANSSEAQLFSVQENTYGKQIEISQRFDGNLVGVVNLYGTYYFATDKNYFYTLSKNTTTLEWTWTSAHKTSSQYPSHLTADVYGNLYVACGSSVYTYTEETFATVNTSTNAVLNSLPENTTKIQIDYHGNLYALNENKVHKFTPPTTQDGKYTASTVTPLNDELVYGSDGAVTSFALSVTDNHTYVLYKDNFFAVTDKLQLPTAKNIPTNNLQDQLFGDTVSDFTVVKITPKAFMVEIDMNELENADVFPYLSHKRANTAISALKIAEIDGYYLLAVYNSSKAKYNTFLVYANACEEYPADGYKIIYEETEQKIGYLSNAASVYKIPYATALFSAIPLVRGDSVTLLGEIVQLDTPYYYVSFTDANGETKTGYIPQAYIAPMNSEAQKQTLVLGGTDTRTDAYGRLIYILFGTATICGLVDYLILRKPKDEDENEENEENEENTSNA